MWGAPSLSGGVRKCLQSGDFLVDDKSQMAGVEKDMNIKTVVVDPLVSTLNPGNDLYFDLIKNMSNSFKGC